jgi:hypothetical protein
MCISWYILFNGRMQLIVEVWKDNKQVGAVIKEKGQ